MQVTLEPISHTYFAKSKGENVVSIEQILMRENEKSGYPISIFHNEKSGYPISIFHIDLFWKDGLKDIHDRLSEGETLTVEIDFKVVEA